MDREASGAIPRDSASIRRIPLKIRPLYIKNPGSGTEGPDSGRTGGEEGEIPAVYIGFRDFNTEFRGIQEKRPGEVRSPARLLGTEGLN